MKRTLLVVGILALVAGMLLSCGGGIKKLDLQLRLEQGKTYGTKMVADQTITQTIQGQTQDIQQTIGMAYTYKVTKVESDGSALVDAVYEWILYSQDGPMGKSEYDSSKPPATIPDAAVGYAALLGQGFSMKLTPLGEVADIQGVDAMLSSILDALNVPEGSARDAVQETLEAQFGEEALAESFEKATAIYPDKSLSAGDSWSKRLTLATGMPMIIDNTWTLKSRKDGVAFVDVKSTIAPNPDAEPLEISGMSVSYEVSGDQTGTLELDEATGWPLRSHMTQNLSGQISAAGMTWPVTITSTIVFEPWEK